jgi:hypothetical protein
MARVIDKCPYCKGTGKVDFLLPPLPAKADDGSPLDPDRQRACPLCVGTGKLRPTFARAS